MVKTMPREVARFIESKFRGLKISEAGYELLSEADEHLILWIMLIIQRIT